MHSAEGTSVVVVGSGGNIGSHLVPHLGRMPGVEDVTLIDRDTYEPKNRLSQDIDATAINKPKAVVQAQRLRRINPELRVTAIVAEVQSVPLGRLRSDVIVAGLDSREARRYVSEAAWHLGIPYLDAGVEPGGLLARVEAFVPGADGPCMQCAWDDRDYALLEQPYPCDAEADQPAPTDAPAALGALAASLQALELGKLLRGQLALALVGRQILIDAAHHNHYVTCYRRNPRCRFDHVTWDISSAASPPARITLGQALQRAGVSGASGAARALWVPGGGFVRAVHCAGCGRVRDTFRLKGRLQRVDLTCTRCGAEMVPRGFDTLERLEERSLPEQLRQRPLLSLGFRPGDIYAVDSARDKTRWYVLGD